jgi:hypothetical protein
VTSLCSQTLGSTGRANWSGLNAFIPYITALMSERPTEQNHQDHNAAAEQQIIHDVEKYGCHFGLIEPDNYLPGFVYSIGLFKTYKHPEIICFGLHKDVLWAVVKHAEELVKSGETLTANKLYGGFLEGYDVQFLPVAEAFYPSYFGYARWFYDWGNFPVLQLVWPDKAHKFPWEDGFNPNWKFKQPLLDRDGPGEAWQYAEDEGAIQSEDTSPD